MSRIEKVVAALKAQSPRDVIVFRGQEKLTKKVEAEMLRGKSPAVAAREYDKATGAAMKKASDVIARVRADRFAGNFDKARASHLAQSSGAELLAVESQQKFSSPYLVSTTRDLSIASGDFHKAPDVRYIYIMQVPRGHAINVHGLVAEMTKSRNLPTPRNQREKELAIPLRATEYVRAIYDLKTDKLVELK